MVKIKVSIEYNCVFCYKKFKNIYFLQKHYAKRHKKYFNINEIIKLNENYIEINNEIERIKHY